ncbi:uncharacterized protein VSU04_004486 isoform 4-T4 [Chlamydotis macqueenii]
MREGSRRRFARIIWGGVRIKTSKMAKHSDNAKWHRRSNIGPIKERSNLPLARLAAAFGKPRSAAEAFSPRRDGKEQTWSFGMALRVERFALRSQL